MKKNVFKCMNLLLIKYTTPPFSHIYARIYTLYYWLCLCLLFGFIHFNQTPCIRCLFEGVYYVKPFGNFPNVVFKYVHGDLSCTKKMSQTFINDAERQLSIIMKLELACSKIEEKGMSKRKANQKSNETWWTSGTEIMTMCFVIFF